MQFYNVTIPSWLMNGSTKKPNVLVQRHIDKWGKSDELPPGWQPITPLTLTQMSNWGKPPLHLEVRKIEDISGIKRTYQLFFFVDDINYAIGSNNSGPTYYRFGCNKHLFREVTEEEHTKFSLQNRHSKTEKYTICTKCGMLSVVDSSD